MFKNRFSLRNLAAVVACLAVIMFSGCEEEDPKDDPIVPKEIAGTWLRESNSNDIAITFNGNAAVFAQISSGDWLTFLNNGTVKIGDQKLRNITQTGNLTWACEELYWQGSSVGWESCTITMSADGTTIETTGAHGKNTYVKGETQITGTWLRERSNNDIAITFSGDAAVFAQITSGEWLTFLNNGKVKIGDQKMRNITQTDNLTWTCEELYWQGSNIGWESCTIIMDADGTIIETTGAHGKNTYVKGELK